MRNVYVSRCKKYLYADKVNEIVLRRIQSLVDSFNHGYVIAPTKGFEKDTIERVRHLCHDEAILVPLQCHCFLSVHRTLLLPIRFTNRFIEQMFKSLLQIST